MSEISRFANRPQADLRRMTNSYAKDQSAVIHIP